VRPAGAILVIAGDMTLAEARRLATKAFGAWKGLKPASLPVAVRTNPPRGIVLVHQPGARDASIIIGGTTFPGTDTAYYAAAVLNRLLGDQRNGSMPGPRRQGPPS
jgi:zinc protease